MVPSGLLERLAVRLKPVGGPIFVFFFLSSPAFPQCYKGDLNQDGFRRPADVALLLNCAYLGNGNCDISFTDVDCDGILTAADIVVEINAVFLATPIICETYEFPVITNADDSNVPENLRNAYRNDATLLAFREVNRVGRAVWGEVDFPTGLIESFYNALVHLHNTIGLAARDSVVNMYNIHTFPSPGLGGLYVKLDTTVAWTKTWVRGERLTGNPAVDQLMECFNLGPVSFNRFFLEALLRTSRATNVYELGSRFNIIAGVRYTWVDVLSGDGPDITALPGDTYWQFNFKTGCGDCEAGCVLTHYWRFYVYTDGRVEFVSSWGPWVPPWGC